MAVAASTANSTARLLSTGNAPGRPRQTGQTFVFGAAPNFAEQPQKALVRVSNCTWTSRPITGSYFVRISGETLADAAITLLILAAPAHPALGPSYSGRLSVFFTRKVCDKWDESPFGWLPPTVSVNSPSGTIGSPASLTMPRSRGFSSNFTSCEAPGS